MTLLTEPATQTRDGNYQPIEQTSQPKKSLQDVLSSIDERLRHSYSNTYKIQRLEYVMEQITRRMENIEIKIGRMETLFDRKLTKIEQAIIGKDLKEESATEQISRKLEEIAIDMTNKISILETKMDMKMERITTKTSHLEQDVQVSAENTLRLIAKEEKHSQFENNVRQKLSNIENAVKCSSNENEDPRQIGSTLTKQITSFESNLKADVEDVKTQIEKINEKLPVLSQNLKNVKEILEKRY